MKTQKFRVMGHDVNYNVPETSEEFNKLDPKRADAACEEATNNIVYRSMNPETRYVFLHGRSADEVAAAAKETLPRVLNVVEGVEAEVVGYGIDVASLGIKGRNGELITTLERLTEPAKNSKGEVRMKDNEPVTKFVESEEVYYNRVLATLVVAKKFASEDAAREHFQPIIEKIASEVPFDVTATERGERGPVKLAAKYKLAAARSLAKGTVANVNTKLAEAKLPEFVATNDSTKMFTGKYPDKNAEGVVIEVDFSVSEKDAETLGKAIKSYQDWKAAQELTVLTD